MGRPRSLITAIALVAVAASLAAIASIVASRGAESAPSAAAVPGATSREATGAATPSSEATVQVAEPADLAAPAVSDAVTVRFYGMRVVRAGVTAASSEGTVTTGRVLEGRAVLLGDRAPYRDGAVRVEVGVFTPARDLPGQTAGRSYLTAAWSVLRAGVDPARAARHDPARFEGSLRCESAFDPASQRGTLAGVATVPAGGPAAAMEGSFTGSTALDGHMLLVAAGPGT